MHLSHKAVHVLPISIMLVVLALFPTVLRADLFTAVQLFTTDVTLQDTGDGGGPRTLAVSESGGLGSDAYSFSATGFVQAEYGVLKVLGESSSSGVGSAIVSTQAISRDGITITSGSLAGQQGLLNAAILVIGTSAANFDETAFWTSFPTAVPSSQSSWGFQLNAGATILDLRQGVGESPFVNCGGCNFDLVNLMPGNPTGAFSFAVPFTFGSEFSLHMLLGGSTITQLGTATANFDLANSIYWGGISSVTFNGDAVNYSLESNSGFDWTQSRIPVTSVPEPGSLILMGAGLLLFSGLLRRKVKAEPES